MKRADPTRRPYLSWCLVVRNCASTLEACLKSLRERTPDAEIVVLDTLSDDAGIDVRVPRGEALKDLPAGAEANAFLRRRLEDAGFKVVFARVAQEKFVQDGVEEPGVWIRVREAAENPLLRVSAALGVSRCRIAPGRTTQEIAQEHADRWEEYAGPDGDWTRDMPWVDDMASPRNAAMKLATGEVVGWVDADDVLPGGAEAERLLRLNGRWHPGEDRGEKGVEVKAADGAPLPTLEDVLRTVFAPPHSVDHVECDYLYRWEGEGLAVTWQVRERFARNDGSYRWVSEGHEFMVPVDAERTPKPAHIPLLFVHMKEHTQEDQSYSITRHYAVLEAKWARGERCGRDGLYLANFSRFLHPERESEFLRGAVAVASTPHDRMRCHIALGNWSAEKGLWTDALEHFACAQVAEPRLPDPFHALATAAFRAEDWPRTVEAFRAAISRPSGCTGSEIPPRVQLLTDRAMLAQACWKIAERQVAAGLHEIALGTLKVAREAVEEMQKFPSLGSDAAEVECMLRLARMKEKSQRAAMDLHAHWDWLVHLDETEKALRVLDVVPHDLEDHPLVVAIERWGRRVQTHLTDRDEYVKFYNSDLVNDALPTPEEWLTLEGGSLPRTRATIAWLKANRPDATIIEFGPYDGVNVIPILRDLPQARVVAVEAQERCAARLEERAERLVPDGRARLTVLRGMFGTDDVRRMLADAGLPVRYDAVLLFEVLEHVPDVASALCDLHDFCKDDGRVFVSTPWGAYDNGSPSDMEHRDPRGHVRAMTLHEVALWLDRVGLVPERGENHAQPTASGVGDTMYVRARRRRRSDVPENVGFYVPSALWDWNASLLHGTGQGASESTIVFLAERLAAEGFGADVFGPVPGEEIQADVGYWRHGKARHLEEDARLVVSRAPYAWRDLLKDRFPARTQADVLWLQDAVYPGFKPEFLQDFRRIVCVSEWHRKAMHERHGMPLEQIDVVPNWVMPAAYLSPAPPRIPHRFVYASSPDRGLIALARMWPRILARMPDAQLHVFYGWEGCVKLAANNPGWAFSFKAMRLEWEALRHQKGIFDRGRVNHATLALEMRLSDAWPYPTDFEETCCANALQARAAGCVPVCTPLAALNETAACPQGRFVGHGEGYEERFVDALEEACRTSEDDRIAMRDEVLKSYSIDAVMPIWKRILKLS